MWREEGRERDEEARALPLSRSRQEFSLIQLPAPQHTERATERRDTGLFDITAMTFWIYKLDRSLDFSTTYLLMFVFLCV